MGRDVDSQKKFSTRNTWNILQHKSEIASKPYQVDHSDNNWVHVKRYLLSFISSCKIILQRSL